MKSESHLFLYDLYDFTVGDVMTLRIRFFLSLSLSFAFLFRNVVKAAQLLVSIRLSISIGLIEPLKYFKALSYVRA